MTEAITKWRKYALGQKFLVRTDQWSLKGFHTQVIHTPEQQKWLVKLMGYDFDIVYKPGTSNTPADALSRRPEDNESVLSFSAFSMPQNQFVQDLRAANITDTWLIDLRKELENSPAKMEGYSIHDGLLIFKRRFPAPLRRTILSEFHSSKWGGHAGALRTFHRGRRTVFGQVCARKLKTS